MPDKWGRPSVDDFAQLQNIYMKGSLFTQQQEDRAENKRLEEKQSEYLDRMSAGEDPAAIRESDPTYSARALMAASSKWTVFQKQAAETTVAQQEAEMGRALQQYEKANTYGQYGIAALKRGDDKAALEQFAKIFNETLVDGRHADVFQDDNGNWRAKIIDQDGSTIKNAEGLTAMQMAQEAETLVGTPGKGGRTNFLTAYFKSKNDRMLFNLEAMEKAKTWTDKKGDKIHVYTTMNEQGNYETWGLDKTENRKISQDELFKMGYTSEAPDFAAEEARLGREKMKWDVEKTKAEINKLKAEVLKVGLKGIDPESREGKLAHDIKRVFPELSDKEAFAAGLDILEEKDLMKEIRDLWADGYSGDDDEVKLLLKSKGTRSKILADALEKAKAGKEKKKAKDPKYLKRAEDRLSELFPMAQEGEAQKDKHGNQFKVVNGKWTAIK